MQGRKVINSKYTEANSFSEGLAAVEKNGKYGFIDKQGNEVIPFIYDRAWDFSEGLASVELNDKSYFIDKQGNLIDFNIGKNFTRSYHNGLAEIGSSNLFDIVIKGKCYFIDKQGNKILSYNYDFVGDDYEGLRMVVLNNKCGYISN